jgi:hypothetical protein
MSKVGIKLKIDVSKIDRNLLFKGQKGTYLDATVFVNVDQADQYGNNGMITQDETKQNREAGHNGPILGNCKVFWVEGQQSAPQQRQSNDQRQPAPSQQGGGNRAQSAPQPGYDDFDQDIPF